ncbi:MAG: hypothetical protein ISQ32_00380 [Rickettsiales bacterium]|nr:hypothetical protein [Rickettsiales bacterium]
MRKLFYAIILINFGITNLYADIVFEKDFKYCNKHQLTFFLKKIYDVYLCNNNSETLNYETIYQQDFALLINYNMSFDSDYLAKSSVKSMSEYFPMSKSIETSYYNELLAIFPDVEKSDVIEARYSNYSIEFFYNNKKIGFLNDKAFVTSFLDIWLRFNSKYPRMQYDLFNQK